MSERQEVSHLPNNLWDDVLLSGRLKIVSHYDNETFGKGIADPKPQHDPAVDKQEGNEKMTSVMKTDNQKYGFE